MKIGVDFDDVVIDFMSALVDYYNKIDGTSYKKEDVISFDLEKLWGGGREGAVDRVEKCIDHYVLKEDIDIPPIFGAVEALKKLKEKHELIIITGRNEKDHNFVDRWTKKHLPDVFSKIIFTNQFRGERIEKSEVCKKEGVEVFIDDYRDTILDVSKKGIKSFLMDAPWNKGEIPSIVKRANFWCDIVLDLE